MLEIVGLLLVLWGLGISIVCGLIGRSIARRAGTVPNAGFALGMTLGPVGVAILSSAIRRASNRGQPYRVM